MNIQIIEKDGKPEWAIIPFDEYQKMQEALEDAEDIKGIEENIKAIREGREVIVPSEVTFAILDGINPVRAWREHKGLKRKELSEKIGISAPYLSQIENGKRRPRLDILKALAKTLGIDVEMLITDE